LLKIKESAENYLETILILKLEKGSVRSIDIANHLGYTKPSISRAMSLLREDGHITVDDGGHIQLTASGLAIAKDIYERHLILSNWLIALGVSPETASEDACRIEHVISKESFEKIKEHAKTLN